MATVEKYQTERSPFVWGLVALLFSGSGVISIVAAVFWFLSENWLMGTILGLIGAGFLWSSLAFWRAWKIMRGPGKKVGV